MTPYLQAIWRLLIQATVVVTIIAALADFLLLISGNIEWLWLALAAFVLSLASGYGAAVDGIQNAARQRVVVAWHQNLMQWLRPMLALGLVAVLGATSRAALLGYALASLLVLGSQSGFLWQRILRQQPRQSEVASDEVDELVKRMRTYAWPFAAWGTLTWLQMASDRWALQVFQGARSVGMYAAVYQLGYYPMVLLSNSVFQLVSPVLFRRAGDGTDTLRLKSTLHLSRLIILGSVVVTLLATLLAFFFHNQIFRLLVSAEYQSTSPYLPWLVLAGGLFASGQAAGLMLMTGGDTRALIAPKIATATAGVLLNVAGAYSLGVKGVVLASVAFAAGYFVWIFHVARNYQS